MTQTRNHDTENDFLPKGITDCKTLLESANREIFQNNAFRITGLPSNASQREISKHGDRLKLLEELGNAPPAISGTFARDPIPTLDDIRTALQRLKNPEQRVIDEFFWFWPTTSNASDGDSAFSWVQQGEVDKAIGIWRNQELETSNSAGALHNLAVAYSIAALDRENAMIGRAPAEEKRAKCARFWQSAIKRWLKIVNHDQLWEIIAERIRYIDEPNLTTGFARQLRQNLLVALCKIHGELALAYVENSQSVYAQAQIGLMRQLGQNTGADKQAAEIILKPVILRLRQQKEIALQRALSDPRSSCELARELISLTRRVLTQLELLTGNDHLAGNDLFDDIADTVNRIQIAYHKSSDDNQGCLEILQEVLGYARTPEMKDRIAENIATLHSNIAYVKLAPAYAVLREISESKESPNKRFEHYRSKAAPLLTFITADLEEESTARNQLFDTAAKTLRELSVEAWNESQDLDTAELILQQAMTLISSAETRKQLLDDQNHLERIKENRKVAAAKKLAQEKAKKRETIIGLALGAGILILIFVLGSNSETKSAPTSSSPNTNYSSDSNRTYRIPRSMSSELSRDRQAIENERATIKTLQNQIDVLGSQIERERPYIDNTSQYAIDTFNNKVSNYNQMIERARSQNAYINQMVDTYNAKLQRTGR